ncbi:MoaD/ThiS family protein [Sinimarinibacterium sp. CAU 1509]|nr:MoaD/ThiS family protein [Sinimarinibacterium sp. CAU 1509]
MQVLCYGATRRHVDGDVIELALAEPATVADALSALSSVSTELAELLKQCAVAIGDELVRRNHPLHAGDALALLPPVAGG